MLLQFLCNSVFLFAYRVPTMSDGHNIHRQNLIFAINAQKHSYTPPAEWVQIFKVIWNVPTLVSYLYLYIYLKLFLHHEQKRHSKAKGETLMSQLFYFCNTLKKKQTTPLLWYCWLLRWDNLSKLQPCSWSIELIVLKLKCVHGLLVFSNILMVFSVIALGFWDKKNASAQCNIITSGILHNRTLAFTYDFCPYWIMCIFITEFYRKLCDKNTSVIHSEKKL